MEAGEVVRLAQRVENSHVGDQRHAQAAKGKSEEQAFNVEPGALGQVKQWGRVPVARHEQRFGESEGRRKILEEIKKVDLRMADGKATRTARSG